MLENIHYDIMETITIISKSLYRYDTYMKDSGNCKSCQEIWTKIKEHRQEELKMLLKEMKSHIDSGNMTLE